MESHDRDEPLDTRLVHVRGQVQGIGYRRPAYAARQPWALQAGSATLWTAPSRRCCKARRSNWRCVRG